ncbi:hypothetical protein ACNOYE_28345 [Nannocystaceae bacterium ST9]
MVVAIGASSTRRATFEAALRTEGLAIATGTIDDSIGPWQQIAAIAGAHATASVGWSVDESAQRRLFDALNLGREAIHELPAGLVLWIGGLGAIESFPELAPDLWAYRVMVVWVLAVEDFEIGPVIVDRGTTIDAELRGLEGELARLGADDPERILLLGNSSLRLREAERFEQARAALAEIEQIWQILPETDRARQSPEVLWVRLGEALRDGRDDDALDLLAPVEWQAWGGVDVGPVAQVAAKATADLAGRRGNDGLADEALRVASRHSWSSVFDRGLLYSQLGVFSIELIGDIETSLAACRNAESEVHDRSERWRTFLVASSVRARVAIAQLRLYDAIVEYHHAWRSQAEHGLSQFIPRSLLGIVESYESMGSLQDAMQLVNRTDDGRGQWMGLRARLFAALGKAEDACEAVRSSLDRCDTIQSPLDRALAMTECMGIAFVLLNDLLDRGALMSARELAWTRIGGLIELARANRQSTIVQHMIAWRLQLSLDLGRVDEAESLLPELLAWSQAHEGPRGRAQRHLAAARVALARHDPHRAAAAVDNAELALREEVERLQSRYVWREILEVRADTLAMQGNFASARATLSEAHDRMHAAGLEREALRVLHRLAEPLLDEPSSPEALASREPAALAALRISAAAGLVYEEARALANVAVVHAERGRAEPARKMLDEAIWLAEGHLGLQAHLDRCAAIKSDGLRAAAPR